MKTHSLILSFVLLVIGVKPVFGVVVLPPAAVGTNNLALQASQIHEVAQRYFDSGQLDQLQKEVNLIQVEFLFLAIGVTVAGAACLLTIRSLRNARRIREDHTKEPNATK